jgi:very-short-patch-repair endonuclease
MTEAERKLWGYLRDRRFGGRKFRRQHPVGPYFLDFYCPEGRLAIELDGSQHAEDAQRLHDEKRSSDLERFSKRS